MYGQRTKQEFPLRREAQNSGRRRLFLFPEKLPNEASTVKIETIRTDLMTVGIPSRVPRREERDYHSSLLLCCYHRTTGIWYGTEPHSHARKTTLPWLVTSLLLLDMVVASRYS